ncbi:MAG TPA: SpoIID/LytB domain-containing protein [Tepidisphaeraceae bacterium]
MRRIAQLDFILHPSYFILFLFLCLCVSGCVAPVGTSIQPPPLIATPAGVPVVRVRLLANQTHLTISASSAPNYSTDTNPRRHSLDLARQSRYTLTLSPAGWSLGGSPLGLGRLRIYQAGDGTIAINNKRYRGDYELVPVSTASFDVVNQVDVESYLKGVILGEMYPKWPYEAYRAQAVAARTYAIYESRTAPAGQSWNLYADTRSQVYGGMRDESPLGNQAVDSTRGVVLAYGPRGEERIFCAYFSSCSGGVTQDSSAVFGFDLPPLRAHVVGNWCSASPQFVWTVNLSKWNLAERFRRWGQINARPIREISSVNRIDVHTVNAYHRPTSFVITDNHGRHWVLPCEELRHAVNTGGTVLRSSFVSTYNGSVSITFTGHGSGHGVGLDQWACAALAKAGYRHESILLWSYPGAVLIRAY